MDPTSDFLDGCRDRFRIVLGELHSFFHGLFGVIYRGRDEFAERVTEQPEEDMEIQAGFGFSRAPRSYGVTFSDALAAYDAHKRWLFEMMHGRVIAKWHDFSTEVFRCGLESHLQGRCVSSAFAALDLRLRLGTGTSLEQAVTEGAAANFGFLDFKTRLEALEKLAGRKLTEPVRTELRKHVMVRNLSEHNDTVLRQEDLRLMGATEVPMLDDWGEPKRFGPGQRVEVTFWGALDALNIARRAADELCGDVSPEPVWCRWEFPEDYREVRKFHRQLARRVKREEAAESVAATDAGRSEPQDEG